MHINPNSSFITTCLGDSQDIHKSSSILVPVSGLARARNSSDMNATSKKEVGETFELESWHDFWNFKICRMDFRSEVSSCASRPVEAMVWINEIESAKSSADLKT